MNLLLHIHGVALPAIPGPMTGSLWLLWEPGMGSMIFPLLAGNVEGTGVTWEAG